jgi:hypothetical protein
MFRERADAAALRKIFPDIEQLRVELTFSDSRARAPSPQVHTLYPPAPAFFRFPCPCPNCDGDFDLTAVVRQLLTGSSSSEQGLRGQLSCGGTRFRGPLDATCSVALDFRLTSAPLHD